MYDDILILNKNYIFDSDSITYRYVINNNITEEVVITVNKIYSILYKKNNIKYSYTGKVYKIIPDSIYIDVSQVNDGKKIRLFANNIIYCKEVVQ